MGGRPPFEIGTPAVPAPAMMAAGSVMPWLSQAAARLGAVIGRRRMPLS